MVMLEAARCLLLASLIDKEIPAHPGFQIFPELGEHTEMMKVCLMFFECLARYWLDLRECYNRLELCSTMCALHSTMLFWDWSCVCLHGLVDINCFSSCCFILWLPQNVLLTRSSWMIGTGILCWTCADWQFGLIQSSRFCVIIV